MEIMMTHFATAVNYPVNNAIANIYVKHAKQEYFTIKSVLMNVLKDLS